MIAGNDFTLRGSNVTAQNGISVNAGGDVAIVASENESSSYSRTVTKNSGLTGKAYNAGKLTVTYEKSKKEEESGKTVKSVTTSSLTSLGGPINIYSGKDVTVSASNITAATGDLSISGENVTIENLFTETDTWAKMRQQAFTIGTSIGLSGKIGSVVGDAYSLDQALKDRQANTDGRLDTLWDLYAARKTVNLGKSIYALGSNTYSILNQKPNSGASDVQPNKNIFAPSNGNFGLKASVTIGTSKSSTDSESHKSGVVASTLQSGGDTTIIARGENSGQAGTGNLSVIGSTVAANGKITLAANNDINLLSAANTLMEKSEDNRSSAAISGSFNLGQKGWGISVGLNGSYTDGEGNGTSVTHRETVINGKEGVEFTSVNDTTLKGTQVIGKSVLGDVGGNLTIISEQDDIHAYSDSRTVGAGVEIPVWGMQTGSANFDYSYKKGKSDYTSVREQSGIYAGEDGFQLNVGKHTDLIGAVIASEADASKNSLTTGSIATRDLDNHSSYDVSQGSIGWNGTIDFNFEKNAKGDNTKQPDYDNPSKMASAINPSLPQNASGGVSSTTKSGVAAGTVTITDPNAQLAKTGDTSAEAVAKLNRDTAGANPSLPDNPNIQNLLKEFGQNSKLSGMVQQIVGPTIADITNVISMAEKAQLPDKKDEAALKAIAAKWGPQGTYTQVLNMAANVLYVEMANGEGMEAALAQLAGHLSKGEINKFSNELAGKMIKDEKDTVARQALANQISTTIVQGLGYGVSGGSWTGANVNTPKSGK